MWYLLLSLIVIVVIALLSYVAALYTDYPEDAAPNAFVAALITGFILLCAAIPVLGFTTGLYPDYSQGTREGYITKLSEKGLICKTLEGEMQVGTGQMSALQAPWEFSVVDEMTWQWLQANLGKRVRLHYREWLLQPFQEGGSGYEITGFEAAE